MKSKILKIGIEIEGEFTNDLHPELLALGGEIKGDGSVHSCSTSTSFHKKFPDQHLHTAEYVSQPVAIEDKKHFKKLFDLLEKAKKEGKFHWNKTAGFHVHLSFKPKVPPEIRSTKFTKYMLDKIQDEFPLEYRIRTAGRWCRVDRLDDEEFLRRPTDRYKAINFASFSRHGTLEFRIFPAKHPYKMYEYFRFVVKTTREYLELEQRISAGIEIETKPMPKFNVSSSRVVRRNLNENIDN